MNKEADFIFLKVKEWFRRNPKTSWGKNELVKQLDGLHDMYNKSDANVSEDSEAKL